MKICYINPTFLVRRPIAELVDRLGDDNDVAVFLPKRPFSSLGKWHNDKALGKAKIYSYSAVSLPGNFEWPIPITPMFFVYLFRVFRYDVLHMWTYFYINSWAVLFGKIFSKKKR